MIEFTKKSFLEKIPDYVIEIAETLQKSNYQAFLVGGSIRDILLGKTPLDFDIATNAYPEQIEAIFPKSIPTGAKFGTVTVIGTSKTGENFDVQVTTYRNEADYFGGRWPAKVEFARTIEEDLSRRDFTINSIALDLQNFDNSDVDIIKMLVDPYEGLKDLSAGIIKAVRDPLERLTEDGLRAVRACRLASQLGFSIEDSTLQAIKETNHITEQVSAERFRDEFLKILYKSAKPSVGLLLLKDTGILKLFIPELLECVGVVQPEFHTDDVFDHSLKACDLAEDRVKIAALFHDLGKARTMSEDDKGIHFYGHDVVGAEMTQEIMKRLKFSNEEIEKTVRLVRWHMFYYPSADWRKSDEELKGDDKGWKDGAIRRLIINVGGEEGIDDLLRLRIADAAANPKNDFNPKELDELSERVANVRASDMALKITDLAISGEDLMKELGLQPGKQLGAILKHLLEKVLDEPIVNKREDLLAMAKEYVSTYREAA
jgi:tRNA nucleotidyltransferase (CCA-adding enzyme)